MTTPMSKVETEDSVRHHWHQPDRGWGRRHTFLLKSLSDDFRSRRCPPADANLRAASKLFGVPVAFDNHKTS